MTQQPQLQQNAEQEENENEKLTITANENHALNMIEGLSEKAFYLVVCATRDSSGRFVLNGTTEAFDELAADVSDEIYYKLSPKSRLKQLQKLYNRLRPDCDEF